MSLLLRNSCDINVLSIKHDSTTLVEALKKGTVQKRGRGTILSGKQLRRPLANTMPYEVCMGVHHEHQADGGKTSMNWIYRRKKIDSDVLMRGYYLNLMILVLKVLIIEIKRDRNARPAKA